MYWPSWCGFVIADVCAAAGRGKEEVALSYDFIAQGFVNYLHLLLNHQPRFMNHTLFKYADGHALHTISMTVLNRS